MYFDIMEKNLYRISTLKRKWSGALNDNINDMPPQFISIITNTKRLHRRTVNNQLLKKLIL